MHLDAVTDVVCWLARVSECARHLYLDAVNLNPALRRFTVKIVAKAGSEGRKQQLASIDAGAVPHALWSYSDGLLATVGFDLNGVT